MGTEVPRIRVRDFGALSCMQPGNSTNAVTAVQQPAIQATQQPIFLCQSGATQQNLYLAFLPNGSQLPLQGNGSQLPLQGIVNPPSATPMIQLPIQQQRIAPKPDVEYLGFKVQPGKDAVSAPSAARTGQMRTYQRLPVIPNNGANVLKRSIFIRVKPKPPVNLLPKTPVNAQVPPKTPVNAQVPPKPDKRVIYYYSHGHILKKSRVVLEKLKLEQTVSAPKSVSPPPIPAKTVVRKRKPRDRRKICKCSKCKTVTRSEDLWINSRSRLTCCVGCVRKFPGTQRSIDEFVKDIRRTVLELSDCEDEEVLQFLSNM